MLIADGAPLRHPSPPACSRPPVRAGRVRLLGTELWSGEAVVATTPALRGAWFSTVSDSRYGRFATSYKTRFGARPYRVATLGYDGVLLTLRIARAPTGGREPSSRPRRMFDDGGFVGLDGAFRFRPTGVIERALEVREVQAGGTVTVSLARGRPE